MADTGRGLEPTMKEKDVRDYIRTFLRNGVRNLVVPASMGIGLALVGCSTSPLMSNPDGAGDSSSMLPGSGGAGGTSSTGVPGTGGTMYGQGGFSNGGSTGGGTGGRSSTGVPGTGGTVYGTGGFPYPGSRDGGMSDAVAKPEESDAGSASDAMTSEVGVVEPTNTLDASRDGETGE